MGLSELSTSARELVALVIALAAITGAVRRYVVKPTRAFAADVMKGVATVNRLETQVEAITKAVGPNGGKAMMDVLNRTAGRVNLIIDHSSTPTWEANSAGLFTRVNPAFELLFGYSAANALGHGWKNLLHEDDADDVLNAWDHCVQDRRVFHYSTRLIARDGRIMAVVMHASPSDIGSSPESTHWMGSILVTSVEVAA